MSNVVLVIDMVKGFLEPGHNLYCGDESREIIPRVHALLTREREAGSEILFISDHHDPDDLDDAIMEMINYDGPVIFDCLVEKHENCFPMIPSGKAHNEMLLPGDHETQGVIDAKGSVLV